MFTFPDHLRLSGLTDDMDDSLLVTIEEQFLAMLPVRNFVWMFSDQFVANTLQNMDAQLSVLRVTVKSDVCKKYPPSLKYQQSFLKSLIQKCEENNHEVVDDLYETYTELLSQPQSETQDHCYRTYILFGASCAVTLKESVSLISQGTTGLNTWPAASCLTEWVVENKEVFSGRAVLELGSGMGLTGLAVCKLCQPTSYVFSDCHASVLRGLRENIAINVPGSDLSECLRKALPQRSGTPVHQSGHENEPVITVECIDWEAVDEKDVKRLNAGLTLAADVVYDTRIIEPLVHLLHMLLRCQGDGQGRPVAVVASTVRNEETYAAFLEALNDTF
ncbi:protein-lysine N-methyltransferase EEF2KMT-like isoform X2 [Acanthaster planci]|uniref:Protein-lysine N-methyltransferase EEF2KMT-like isoform X2 n=1 Tax=Acanthaster planci TaxID=133434 RepID=A0A8B7YQ90_ACAPL|nr:protein-lysine N-methyltransferase EEF2KMT-like isoform X2 [Acanthaster planci]